jgi:hypothetical protein
MDLTLVANAARALGKLCIPIMGYSVYCYRDPLPHRFWELSGEARMTQMNGFFEHWTI